MSIAVATWQAVIGQPPLACQIEVHVASMWHPRGSQVAADMAYGGQISKPSLGRHGLINGFLGAKESSNSREKGSRSFLIIMKLEDTNEEDDLIESDGSLLLLGGSSSSHVAGHTSLYTSFLILRLSFPYELWWVVDHRTSS
ncbi:hypothetical protein Tco_1504761 [Tanacetum coccineum]